MTLGMSRASMPRLGACLRPIALAAAIATTWAGAADHPSGTVVTAAGLPATAQAQAWLEQDPSVAQARHALAAARHAGAAIAASPAEWSARLQSQQRRYRAAGDRSAEWLVHVERPWRINGKTDLDRRLGELEVTLAQARLGEARHESARALAELWLELAQARLQARLLEEQAGFARANLETVQKRNRAGDASLLETHLAQADLAEAERAASQATTQVLRAQARLQGRFPGATPQGEALVEPGVLDRSLDWWRVRILSESDPLKTAQALQQRAALAANRAQADRVADPTVGFFTTREARGDEGLMGVSVSIPLGGTYRNERARQAASEADAASAEVERVRRMLTIEVEEAYAEAASGVARWQGAERGALAARANAQLTQRAYALGEADLQVLLLARRQALEATRAALEARVQALRWQHRLLVDAHLVWGLDQE